MDSKTLKIVKCQVFCYSLPLTNPLSMKGHKLVTREGLIIELRAGDFIGYGEIAPFPGLHKETLAQAQKQIVKLSQQLPGQKISKLKTQTWDHCFPSVSFGLEMATHNILMQISNNFSTAYRKKIPLNALLTGNKEEIYDKASLLKTQGYSFFKLKVGKLSLEEDFQRIKVARKAIKDNILFLDANRSWTLDQAIAIGKKIADSKIYYIEEPLQESKYLSDFYKATGIAIALDETIAESSSVNFVPPQGTRAFVLKASALGIKKTMQWAQLGEKENIISIISSCFETGAGLWMQALLGAMIKSPFVGLGTYQWFKYDLVNFKALNGEIHIQTNNWQDNYRLDKKRLLCIGLFA